MGKSAVLLPDEYKEVAIENNISLQTVYARIRRGWDLDRAVMEEPRQIENIKGRKNEGEFTEGKRPKSKAMSFCFYEDRLEDLEEAIVNSGKTKSDFICDALEHYLKYLKSKK